MRVMVEKVKRVTFSFSSLATAPPPGAEVGQKTAHFTGECAIPLAYINNPPSPQARFNTQFIYGEDDTLARTQEKKSF